jgi:hypothetical protein
LLLLISCIGILFIPVFLALFLFSLFVGLITVYVVVGERMMGGLAGVRPSIGAALRGMLAVHACALIGSLLGAIAPFLGPFPFILSVFGKVIVFLCATVGLGCVLYTRFGRRNVGATGAGGEGSAWGRPAPAGGAGPAGFGPEPGVAVDPPPFPETPGA